MGPALGVLVAALSFVTSATAAPMTAVTKGATWKFLAGPSDLGTPWRAPGYDDSLWPEGPAPLGYGESYIATPVPFGPSSSSKWRTTYFRVTFEVTENPAEILSLTLQASYDDGFVAYLNGTEVQRAAMPVGPITYSTFASNHEAGAYETFNLAAFTGLLQSGTNVLAVELHQTSAGSSDLVLDMELRYSSDSINVTRGPYLQIGTPTAMTVRWRTDVPVPSTVRYGLAPGALNQTAGQGTPVREHEVTLATLSSDTRYYYSIGTPTDTLGGDSSYTFHTSPPHGSTGPARLWIIGDSGQGNQNARNVYSAYRDYADLTGTDLWLMLGDNAYNTGTDAQYQAGVFDIYPELLRSSSLWPTRGNHDHLHSGPNNDYYEILSMPTDGAAGGLVSGSEAYYSFDYANVHFICLDSEGTDRSLGGAMLQWLRADLAATAQPWIVAFWHHPPYTKGSHDSDDPGDSGGRMRDMRQNVLPILDSTGVDLVLTGHSHSYERSFLLNGHYGLSGTLTNAMKIDAGDGRDDGDGPYVKPTAGHGPFEGAIYSVAGSSSQISGGILNHPVMVQSSNLLGSLVLDVHGQRMEVRFLSDSSVVRDSFTIIKGPVTGVPVATLKSGLHLAPVRPNPASGTVRVEYTLAAAGDARLSVHDVSGRRVTTLARGPHMAGTHSVAWDGGIGGGGRAVPGVYYALLEFGGELRAVPIVRVE
jgi:hypothetical protein